MAPVEPIVNPDCPSPHHPHRSSVLGSAREGPVPVPVPVSSVSCDILGRMPQSGCAVRELLVEPTRIDRRTVVPTQSIGWFGFEYSRW
jgi:hypothetical protein